MWGCLSWLYLLEFTQSRLWSLALQLRKLPLSPHCESSLSRARFLEAVNWHSLGDWALHTAVFCPPKFTKKIVFTFLCLFSNVPSALKSSIWEKEHCSKKMCGQTLFLLIFSYFQLQNQTWRKGFGYRRFIGETVYEAQKGNGQSETKKGEKLITSMLMSKLLCGQLGLSSAGNSLRNHVGHVSESSHWRTGSLWYLCTDFHPHWSKVSPTGVNYPALPGCTWWRQSKFSLCQRKPQAEKRGISTWGGRLWRCWKLQLQVK